MRSKKEDKFSPVGIAKLLVKSILMFLFIYDINLSLFGLPTFLTTRRLVVIGLLFYILISKGLNRTFSPRGFGICWNPFYKIMLFQFFILVYSLLLLIVVGKGTGDHMIGSSFRLLLLGFFPVFIFKEVFENVDDFMRSILLATLLQSGFVIYCLIDPLFGVMLDSTFSLDEDYVQDHRIGYAGGLNCITAPGCLKFSMGLVAAVYFCIKHKTLIWYAIFIFLSVIATMIARTGLLLSICGLLIILFEGFQHGSSKMIIRIIFPLSIVGIFLLYFVLSGGFDDLFDFKRLQMLTDGGEGQNRFFKEYFEGDDIHIPPLSIDTLIGLGITSGVSASGIQVITDGGFLKVYASVGIIFCILFYINYFVESIKIKNHIKDSFVRNTLTYFLMVIVLGEFKEVAIYSQYMVSFYFTTVALYEKSIKRKKQRKCLQLQKN